MKAFIPLFILALHLSNSVFSQIGQQEYNIQQEYDIDSTGTVIVLPHQEYRRITAKDNSSWGFINEKNETVIPLGKYEFLNPIDDHGMILAHKDGKEGFIDITEKVLIPFIYDNVGIFSKDIAPVIKDGKQGFINRKGEIVIPLEYDGASYVTHFHDQGFAILAKNGKYGVINPQNKVIIPFEHEKINISDNEDCFIITREEEWATFSFDGKQLSEFNNYIIISDTQLSALPFDKKNLPILVTTEESQSSMDNLFMNTDYLNGTKQAKDSITASLIKEFAYIDKTQKIIVPFGTYDYAEPFGLGRKAIVARKGAYGIIDEYGKAVLPLNYVLIERPSQYSRFADIFLATQAQKVTVFDKNINPLPIDSITSYLHWNGDLFITNTYNKKGVLDYKGTQTIPFEYDSLYRSPSGGFVAQKGNLYGNISENNEILKPFIYKKIHCLYEELAFVNTDGKAGVYNKKRCY